MKIPFKAPLGGARNDIVNGDRVTPDPRAAKTITIITSIQPSRVCKAYTTRVDGVLDKSAIANITEGIAQSYIVPDADEMARLWEDVTSSDNKVIVPARWHNDDGSPFFIYSKAKLAALLGCAEEDVPVGIVEHEGRRVRRVSRPGWTRRAGCRATPTTRPASRRSGLPRISRGGSRCLSPCSRGFRR
jgi:hypothetical protein